ncbi:MAG TPA: CBS domain-containing protein [Flavitalea sp.]|nr:CBS domain-containing protein [Flavitalea sp.]
MQTVADILNRKSKPLNNISSTALVYDGLQMLNLVNLSYLVVIDDGQFKGIFCERDYTRNVILKGRSSMQTPVGEVMTTDLPRVELNVTVEQCMQMMNAYGTRYLLAFNKDEFVGVITIHDILRQVIASKENVFDHTLTHSLLNSDESGGKVF